MAPYTQDMPTPANETELNLKICLANFLYFWAAVRADDVEFIATEYRRRRHIEADGALQLFLLCLDPQL